MKCLVSCFLKAELLPFLASLAPWRLIAFLFFLCPFHVFAEEEKWVFLPGSSLFRPLIGDLREPLVGLIAYGNQNRFEGAIGGTIEFLRHEAADGAQWGWGILGSGFILLDQDGAVFPMRDGDWHAGMYLSRSTGLLSHKLVYIHQSSHLGDSLEYDQEPSFFSRENFNITSSFQPDDSLRIYAGVGAWVNGAPFGRPFFASLGTELYTPAADLIGTTLRGYATCHLKWKDETGGILNKTFQLGAQWKLRKEETKAIRLALIYFDGYSEYGQFYTNRDEHWGFAVYFDP